MAESYFIFSNGELKRKDNVVRITAPDGRFKDIKIDQNNINIKIFVKFNLMLYFFYIINYM